MKLIIKIAFALVLIFVGGDMYASGGQSVSSSQTIKIVKKGTHAPNLRPHLPSLPSVECDYDEGTLYIEFRVSEGACTLEVVPSDGVMQVHHFDSSEPTSIYIGEVCGAELTITTSAGNTYEGVIE